MPLIRHQLPYVDWIKIALL